MLKTLTQILLNALVILLAAQTLVTGQVSSNQPPVSAGAVKDEALRQLLDLPAPTPRTAQPEAEAEKSKEHPSSFYDSDKVPPDDAPEADLIDYWERRASNSGRPGNKPTDAVSQRLIATCEAEPERLPRLLPLLSDTEGVVERVKKLYDVAVAGDARFDDEWRKGVRGWLQFNSRYFLDDLQSAARKAVDKDSHVDKKESLQALAKVDWESAEALLHSFSVSGQPRTSAFALTLLYRHALAVKDAEGEEKYRARLQAIAVDRTAPAHARDTVIEELLVTEWSGRDDWYLSLLADETLLKPTDGYYLFHPLTTLFDRDPDKWIPVMTKLVESPNVAVRQNAAGCLVLYATAYPRRDAILPVLRWLSDPNWLDMNGSQRAWFMQKMDELEMPESVPGLIWIVEHEEGNRHWAARTLAHYKDARAIPALKKALADENNEDHRHYLLDGLLASGGISEAEQLQALENYTAGVATSDGREEIERYRSYGDKPLPLPVSIGKYLAGQKDAPDSLVHAVLARAEILKKKNPAQAQALLRVAEGWQSKQIDIDMLRRIGAGTADAATLANALERRAKLRESVMPELQLLTGSGGTSQGVAAVLLEDEAMAQSILASNDDSAKLATLASARLTQLSLPIDQVGALLGNKNALLALAAERYLLAEDSKEARELLWAHHSGEAFITGWRENIQLIGGSDFSAMGKAEEKLRAELFKKEGAPVEIFALLGNDERPQHVLRVYSKSAVYTHYEDASRYRERVITSEELARFNSFVTTNNLLEFGPQIGPCHYDCSVAEFLSLKRDGGRRVFSHQGVGAWITVLANFDLLGRNGAKFHYQLEDEIKELEILFADESLSVKDVWRQGDDLRVLIEREATPEESKQEELENKADSENEDEDDATRRVKLRQLELEHARARISWRYFTDKLGAAVAQPDGYTALNEAAFEIDDQEFPSHLNAHLARAIAGKYVLLASDLSEGGLWKKSAGGKAVRVSGEGVYANPVVTPDGVWVVAAKTETDWSKPNDVIRFNLKTNREYRVSLPAAEQFEPLAYLPAHDKILLRRARDERAGKESDGPAAPEFYLLDAVTGRTQLVNPSHELENAFVDFKGVSPDGPTHDCSKHRLFVQLMTGV